MKKIKIILIIITIASICFGQKDIPNIWHGDTVLFVSPENSANNIVWGDIEVDITVGNGASNLYNGQENTSAIVEQLGEYDGILYAAKICDTLNAYGYSDWYLPAWIELIAICNKKDSIGENFLTNGNDIYWGSTEFDSESGHVSMMSFGQCEGYGVEKEELNHCRCIRREYPTKVKTNTVVSNVVFLQNESLQTISLSFINCTPDLKIQITDMTGKAIYLENNKSSINEQLIINYNDFTNGVYIITISGESINKSFKFLVK